MKILLLHSDFFEFEPRKKAIKQAEDVEKKPIKVNDALVVLSAVEKRDEKNIDQVAKNTAKEIEDVFKEVKAKNIVVYPYAHLSSDLAVPDKAMRALKEIEGILKSKGYNVVRAPFGWYKRFTISCKGHPLAELSREVYAEGLERKKDEVSEAVKKEEQLKSDWFIIDTKGKLHKIKIEDGKVRGFDFSKHKNLEKLAKHEMAKSRKVDIEPPHIKLMRRLQLVDYEEASDPGNFRFMPAGRLVKSLIEEWTTRKTVEYGAMEVETPIMYDYEHPVLKSYLNRFPSRQYMMQTPNKKVFLRFSACFGQFLMLKDANLSYRNLPLWIYEMTKYSFRAEQHGELAGLRRLRTFTMPDCHAICRDIEQAKQEMLKRFDLAKEVQKGFDLTHKDMDLAIRVVKDFYGNNKEFVKKLVKKWGNPALFEVWDKRFFYFVLKYEFNFIDALDKAAAMTTDQIDVENAERYGIKFMDKDNKKKYPLILHQSPPGAIERVMYALLEKAYMQQQKGKTPVLPLWLSPTQIRLCPVSDKFMKLTERIAKEIEKESIRVDIDDRIESVPKKVRDAETEWIPIIVVIGEKEKKSGKLAVRFRESGKIQNMTHKQIIKHVRDKTSGFPFKPLALPKMLTKRPVFIG